MARRRIRPGLPKHGTDSGPAERYRHGDVIRAEPGETAGGGVAGDAGIDYPGPHAGGSQCGLQPGGKRLLLGEAEARRQAVAEGGDGQRGGVCRGGQSCQREYDDGGRRVEKSRFRAISLKCSEQDHEPGKAARHSVGAG